MAVVSARLFATLEDRASDTLHYLAPPSQQRSHGRYLGTRKLRRLMNESFADSVVDVDSVVDFGGDPLGILPGERDGPLRALTCAQQLQLRRVLLAHERPLAEPGADEILGLAAGALARVPCGAPPYAELGGARAMWRRVERRLRPALRAHAGGSEVGSFEAAARCHLRAEADAARGAQRGGHPLVLRAESAFGRLLAHAVCQFYALQAASVDMSTGGRAVVAGWRGGAERARLGAAVSLVHAARLACGGLAHEEKGEEEATAGLATVAELAEP